MRSIRATLLASFLTLAALSLGGICWYAYRATEQSLMDRDIGMIELLKEGHKDRCQSARDRFDDELLRRTIKVASRTQTLEGGKVWDIWGLSNALLLGLHPTASAPPLHWAAAPGAPIYRTWSLVRRVAVADELLPRESDSHEIEYCVIMNHRLSPVQHSPTLANRDLPEPDAAACEKLERGQWLFDDFTAGNQKLRRLIYKSSVSGRTLLPTPFVRGMGGNGGRGSRGAPPFSAPAASTPGSTAPAANAPRQTVSGGAAQGAIPAAANAPPVFSFAYPTFYVQYARDTERLDHELARYGEELRADQAAVLSRTKETLARLRWRLGLVLLGSFAAVLMGGMWLGRRSLRPLNRLTDAVSQVNEKDFDLKLDPAQMPEELAPIVSKLKTSLASLEKAFVHEKQAVADISHELRTPIASLVATIQVCLKKQRSAEEYRSALQTCAEIGGHLHELTHRLLTLARLDAGVDRVQSELLDLADVARACLDIIRPLAEAKGLTVTGHLHAGVLVESDANKLREIMINLLSNAVQYNRPQGKIELRVRREQGQAILEVKDTGIGISPEARRHLFERFWRADPSRHSDRAHAGLGLAIVKGYVALLKGNISVESEPGHGAIFRVALPLAADTDLEETVVEDQPAERQMARSSP